MAIKLGPIGLIILLWSLVSLSQAATPRDPYQFFFEQSLGDLSEELEIAREEGKKGLFIFFEMDECPFCHRMKKTVLNQPEIQDYFRQNFHSISIDIEGDIELVDLPPTAVVAGPVVGTGKGSPVEARVFTRGLGPGWRINSFSSMTRDVHQAALSLRRWFPAREPPLESMRRAADNALGPAD